MSKPIGVVRTSQDAAAHPAWCDGTESKCNLNPADPDGDRLHMRTILRMVVKDADALDLAVEVHMWVERLDTTDEGNKTRVIVDSRRHNQRHLDAAEIDKLADRWPLTHQRQFIANAAVGNTSGCIIAFTAAQAAAEMAKAYGYAAELLAEADQDGGAGTLVTAGR